MVQHSTALPALLLLLLALAAHLPPPASASARSSPRSRLVGGQAALQGAGDAPRATRQATAPADGTSARRRMTQAETAVERCRDAPDGTPAAVGECVACDALQRAKTASCRVWVDRVAITYPRGSSEPPTPDQEADALAQLQGTGVPSRECCAAMGAALQGRCGCNRWADEPAVSRAAGLSCRRKCRPFISLAPSPTRTPSALLLCSLFQYVREVTALEEPTLSVSYLRGSNKLLAEACGHTDPALLECT